MKEHVSSEDETVKGLRSKVKSIMDRSFEGLRVWQQSRTFVNDIYDIMDEVKDYGKFQEVVFNKLKSEAISISNQIYRLIKSISGQGRKP